VLVAASVFPYREEAATVGLFLMFLPDSSSSDSAAGSALVAGTSDSQLLHMLSDGQYYSWDVGSAARESSSKIS
jgi:hypothetical protein